MGHVVYDATHYDCVLSEPFCSEQHGGDESARMLSKLQSISADIWSLDDQGSTRHKGPYIAAVEIGRSG